MRPGNIVVGRVGGEHQLGWQTSEGADDALGTLADVIHPGRLDEVARLVEYQTSEVAARVPGAVRIRHTDGRWVPMRLEVEAHLDDPALAGWIVRLLPTADDATPTAVQPDRFELLAEVMTAGIITADVDGQVTYANPAARELFWRVDDDLLGHGWLSAVCADDRPDARSASERVRDRGTTEIIEFRVVVVGIERWLRARFNAVHSGAGRPAGWVAVVEDITTDRDTTEELSRQASHDPLTGLPNRLLLEDRLSQALARCRRHLTSITVFFLDLDRFKAVNDLHGHQVGDQVLQEIGRRIRRVVRAEDTAARLGGDEFVVVAEGLTTDAATRVAGRITEAVGAPVSIDTTAGAESLSLRISIGVAWAERLEMAPAALLDAADKAMYEAKRTEIGLAFASLP